jgi:hypothetical protein
MNGLGRQKEHSKQACHVSDPDTEYLGRSRRPSASYELEFCLPPEPHDNNHDEACRFQRHAGVFEYLSIPALMQEQKAMIGSQLSSTERCQAVVVSHSEVARVHMRLKCKGHGLH